MPSGWLSGWLKQGRREKRDSTSRATGSLVSIGSTAGVRLVPTPLPTSISRQRLRSIRTASENPVVPDDDTAPQGIVLHTSLRERVFPGTIQKDHDIPDKVMRTSTCGRAHSPPVPPQIVKSNVRANQPEAGPSDTRKAHTID